LKKLFRIKILSCFLTSVFVLFYVLEILHFAYLPHGVDPLTGTILDVSIVSEKSENNCISYSAFPPRADAKDFQYTQPRSILTSESTPCPVANSSSKRALARKLLAFLSTGLKPTDFRKLKREILVGSLFPVYFLAPKNSPPV
jgi:hypothetical protein